MLYNDFSRKEFVEKIEITRTLKIENQPIEHFMCDDNSFL
jgi:uncharacterized protein YlaI